MSGLLFLLCCILTVTWGNENNTVPQLNTTVAQTTLPTFSKTSTPTSTPGTIQQTSHPYSTHMPSTQTLSTHTPKTSTSPNAITNIKLFDPKNCLPILMVTGGLIIVCAILLISTFMLAWKVCHLSRRLKALASDNDLISSSDFWTGKSSKAKGKVEREDKEDTVLLGELDQKQSDAKEESVMANGDKKKEEEEKEKEEEKKEEKREEGKKEEKKEEGKKEEEKREKKLAGAAEESSSTKPQEDAPSSPPAEPEAAATAECGQRM